MNPFQTAWHRSNDLSCRKVSARTIRFCRARLRSGIQALASWLDEPGVWRAWRKGWDADHYLRLLRWRAGGLHPKTVFDVGSNEGVWAEMCQAVFQPERCVLFEPQRRLHPLARARAVSAGASWEILDCALGSQEQEEDLHLTRNRAASSLLQPISDGVPPAWGTAAEASEPVRIVPLDLLIRQGKLPVPDLVKIDVQGYESRVLEGGKETFARVNALIVEVSLAQIYQGQPLLPEILSTLHHLGFQLEDINETCRSWPDGRLWQVDLWLRR